MWESVWKYIIRGGNKEVWFELLNSSVVLLSSVMLLTSTVIVTLEHLTWTINGGRYPFINYS